MIMRALVSCWMLVCFGTTQCINKDTKEQRETVIGEDMNQQINNAFYFLIFFIKKLLLVSDIYISYSSLCLFG